MTEGHAREWLTEFFKTDKAVLRGKKVLIESGMTEEEYENDIKRTIELAVPAVARALDQTVRIVTENLIKQFGKGKFFSYKGEIFKHPDKYKKFSDGGITSSKAQLPLFPIKDGEFFLPKKKE